MDPDLLSRDFFHQDPREAAIRLIGAELLWHGAAGRIVEVEAYESLGDEACHTFFRPSTREFVEKHLPGAAYVYELTPRGRQLLPVLQTLGEWGRAELGERRPTDAVRAHWFALPLLRELEGEGLVEVALEEGRFHVYAGAEDGPVYGDGPAPAEPDARLALDTATCTAVARGELEAVAAEECFESIELDAIGVRHGLSHGEGSHGREHARERRGSKDGGTEHARVDVGRTQQIRQNDCSTAIRTHA